MSGPPLFTLNYKIIIYNFLYYKVLHLKQLDTGTSLWWWGGGGSCLVPVGRPTKY